MKAITREWLDRAQDDLNAAHALLKYPDLTHVAAFHAQQATEKALKAALEEYDLGLLKTHSLTRLLEVVKSRLTVMLDQDMLDRLEAVYIEARYPSELGLLPYGKPSRKDAMEFFTFAQDAYQHICLALQTGSAED
ncbi:MAG TPA: HEPN domain-containing protein [Anaerolineae bacterium]|nr:HEPN domain-containing protein [Anaerolineae bacterium]HQI83607.1 HEPN domain-containing protein [Anaerolineae bacterium]